MNYSLKLIITASALSLLAACGNNSSTSTDNVGLVAGVSNPKSNNPVSPVISADAYTPPVANNAASQSQQLAKTRDLRAAPVATEVDLGAPDANKLFNARAKNKVENSSIPLTAGMGRNIAQTRNSALTKQLLNWKNKPTGGKVAAINFNSVNAKGLRIGVLVTKLPAAATLRFYAKGATQAIEVKGSEVLSNLALNHAAGDTSAAGRTFWSPRINGAEGVVEIELPTGFSTDNLDISIPILSHLFLSTSEITDKFSTAYSWENDGLTCEVDINCSATVPAVSNAVALANYMTPDGQNEYCTGTLLNDSVNSGTPYFSTANHCISTQSAASTLHTWWFYKSASCNTTSGNYFELTSGATLLFTALDTDGTLLRLNAAAPTGVMYAGWDATPPVLDTAVSGIHHPQVDAQRISNGNILSYSVITGRTATGYFSEASDITNSTLIRTSLLTEMGSSGSALFKNITGANPQVIGQLLGGPAASCTTANYADYGRFDKSFNAGMSDWLVQGLKPVYRFYNNQRGTHFFSQSITEKNFISANYPQFSYENAVFNAYSNADAATRSPVFRFYNSATQSHFYTIDVAEKDGIRAKIASGAWPQFAFEGTSWYAKTPTQFAAAAEGTIPLYRFYRNNGTHFYTASAAEKTSIQTNLSAYYTYEGIAYYVWP